MIIERLVALLRFRFGDKKLIDILQRILESRNDVGIK